VTTHRSGSPSTCGPRPGASAPPNSARPPARSSPTCWKSTRCSGCAVNQLKSLLVTGSADLREQLRPLGPAALVEACARLRPGADLTDPAIAAKTALRRLAARSRALGAEIAEADRELDPLVTAAAPRLVAMMGVGPEVAGQLLVTAGDNPGRLRSEAAFAHLCGVAPIPASSGRIDRHRLNRGGDRAANSALYTVVLCRLRYDPATQAYAKRRTTQGLSKPEIIRCLKRYVAREVYRTLLPLTPPTEDLAPAA
jgi:transposase